MNNSELEEHITELQARIEFQEDTIQTLNELVIEQGAALESLQAQFRKLYKKMDDMNYEFESHKSDGGNERPPHY
ncbi:SlyX family protein [Teredinibacter sp. KSP-S5-2]|uniref:SlyX family protein n=1 Tax=Teredinibacter sp. KSP-S5-2 TaxID=3034506 RepID=UPI0029344C19|nr:SlyX family protein [Teredinibacter sp. KSP-S5-2]WNO11614.1 SlyX family protein [Teredinibacter sp. KSP-S5-2]